MFDADPLARIALDRSAVHIVRGPRQVGKSTSLKRLAERALDQGFDRRHVICLAADLLESQPPAELYASVTRAKDLASATGRCLLMLDEVTVVSRWQNAVKSLWDVGVIRGDVVLCTGSSAIDLPEGAAERLPGRRGGGDDVLVLPQSFSAVARALDSSIPASPELDLAGIVTADGREQLAEIQRHVPTLQSAMERYLRFSGLPAAVAELLDGAAEPSRDVKRLVHDALVKEVARRGASNTAAHALLERLIRSLGSKTNWADMAREMHVKLGPRRRRTSKTTPDPATVRDYVELMADVSARVENLLATHLLRRYEPRDLLLESPAEPQTLHVWAKEAGEIDFIAGTWSERAALEVKYGAVKLSVAANVAKAHVRRPAVVASRDAMVLDRAPYVVAPAAIVAWALGT